MRSFTFATMFCLLGFAATTAAQQQASLRVSATREQTVFVIRRQVAEVAVQFTVTDRHGKAVSGIRRDDLLVLDNGQPITEVTRFGSNDELPLQLALVIDWSDSMQKSFNLEYEGAKDFLRTLLRPNLDEALVVGFRSKPVVTQELTYELDKLENGIHPVEGVRLTALYDSVVAACRELRKVSSSEPQRRVLVLLTDGGDNYSLAGISDAIETAQRDGIVIYAITPQRSYWEDRDGQALMALTNRTGGRVLFMSKNAGTAFRHIEAELRSGYSLYFKPMLVSGESFHSLQIRPQDRNLQVRARARYYAGWE